MKASATASAAHQLEAAIRALGSYAHVSVTASRGHLLIGNAAEPVARLTPLDGEQYGLSFHTHAGKWEPMPFSGNIQTQAQNVVSALGMYLESWELPGRTNGSDH